MNPKPIETNVKHWLQSAAYEKQKEVIRKEINSHPVTIDFKCFKKTPQERALLATLKHKFFQSLKD